ncbi:unnamed protein product [Prunus armeniaca]
MSGGKTLPYLVLHGGGSRRKSLRLRKHSPKIAHNAAMHLPEIASHSKPQDKPSIGNRNVTSFRNLADTWHPCTGEPNRPHLPTCAYTSNISPSPFLLLFETEHNFHSIRQARTGRVFTHLSCRTAGTHGSSFHLPLVPNGRRAWSSFHLPLVPNGRRTWSSFHSPFVPNGRRTWSSFHSPLVPNGRQARVEFSLTFRAERQAHVVEFSLPSRVEQQAHVVEFSLTSHAERQACTGRVFTYPSCRTAGTHGSSFHSPLPVDSLPIFNPTSWLEDLGDYMIITGLETIDARSQVRMPKLRDKQFPNQEVPPRSETWGTTVCTISDQPLTS